MLSIIGNWLYVSITTYIMGFAFLQWVSQIPHMHTAKGKKAHVYEFQNWKSPLLAGLVLATIYAQLFSIIGGVGLIANIVLVIICAALGVYFRIELKQELIWIWEKIKGSYYIWIYPVLILVFAYAASHGLMHYDTDLYHAQAIRWIETFGVTKGLGNIHLRLGYNSASFALSALYSMRFLGKSMHAMAGYFALLLAIQCSDIVAFVRRRHLILSDFVRFIAIYYLFTIMDEIVAPASDYFMTTLVLYILIDWLDLYARHERSFLPHALLSMLAVYAATIKLSAAPMVLLAIYPIKRLISGRKKKAVRPILYFVLLGMLIVFPFLIRNVILTGWLVYPVTSIDLFRVAWKVPLQKAVLDAHEIIAYGRGFTDVSGYDVPMSVWMWDWMRNLSVFNRIMLICDVVCFPVFIGCLVYFLAVKVVRTGRGVNDVSGRNNVFKLSERRTVALKDFVFFEAVLYISLMYWMFSAPLIRYGCIYLWIPGIVLLGQFAVYIYNRLNLSGNSAVFKVICAVMVVFLFYKTAMIIRDDVPRFRAEYLLVQQEYGHYELRQKEIEGLTFYYPSEGDRTGYDSFPAVPVPEGFKPMGKRLQDGYIYEESSQ